MPFIDLKEKPTLTIWPGITGKFMHTDHMSYGMLTIASGTPLPEHSHPHEQWTHLLEGELELTIGDETMILTAGMSAHMPPNVPHSGRTLSDCKLMDCFLPVREDIRDMES